MGWLAAALVSLIAFLWFDPATGLWIAGLIVLARCAPAYAAPAFLVGLSFDQSHPLFSLQVNGSELALLALLLILLLSPSKPPSGWLEHWRELDWTPLLLAVPFAAAVLLSGLANLEAYKVLPHLMRQIEFPLTCWWGVNQLRRAGQALPLAATLLVFPSFQAGMGLFDLLLREGPARGNYGNPNQFSALIAAVIPFLLVGFWRALPDRKAWLWVLSLGLSGFCVWASFSRSGQVATLIAVATVTALQLWKAPRTGPVIWKVALGTVAFLVFCLAGNRLLQHPSLTLVSNDPTYLYGTLLLSSHLRLAERPPAQEPNETLNYYFSGRLIKSDLAQTLRHRVVLQRFALEKWLSQPWFGYGPGTYPAVFGRHREEIKRAMFLDSYPEQRLRIYPEPTEVTGTLQGAAIHPHNLYALLLLELGIFGCFGFVFYIAGTVRVLWKGMPFSGSIAGLGLLAVLLAHSLVEITFYSLAMELGLFLAFAWSTSVKGEATFEDSVI